MKKFVSLLAVAVCAASLSFAQDAAVPADAAAAVVVAEEVAPEADGATAETITISQVEPEMTEFDQFVEHVRQGGVTMIFIGLLSVLGIACALERFWNLRRSRIVPEDFTARVVELWKAQKYSELSDYCASNRSMIARVVATMLEHRTCKDYTEVKMFAEDKAGRELRLETRKAAMLVTVATLSPLLGLFGTVLGLLGAFGTVAMMGEMGDASVLADDIGKALVTTVAGLAVSMPALYIHGILKNRLNLYAVELEEEVSDLISKLFVEGR